jgi:hypothetical protein
MFITTFIILGGPNENDLFTIEEINIIIYISSTQTLIFEISIYFCIRLLELVSTHRIFLHSTIKLTVFLTKPSSCCHIDFLLKLSIKERCENIEMKKYPFLVCYKC